MDQVYVKPDVRAFLETLAASPRPDFTAELLAQIRLMPPAMMAALDVPVGDLAVVRSFEMPGQGGAIALRLFDARAGRASGPVMVFFHGGGFCVGNIDTHAALAAELARALDLPVVSVEYRLAPEHPWPAAPDDAEAAAHWIAANGGVLGLDIGALVLCGDSAGGNLAIVTALALRDRTAVVPVAAVLALYPRVDASRHYASATLFGDGYGLESRNMRRYEEHYRGEASHWRYSPLLADQTGLPPVMVVTAALDPLRDEGRAYAAATAQAGVPTIFREIAGTIHGFASYRAVIASAREDLALVLREAKTLLLD